MYLPCNVTYPSLLTALIHTNVAMCVCVFLVIHLEWDGYNQTQIKAKFFADAGCGA